MGSQGVRVSRYGTTGFVVVSPVLGVCVCVCHWLVTGGALCDGDPPTVRTSVHETNTSFRSGSSADFLTGCLTSGSGSGSELTGTCRTFHPV